VVAVEKHFSNSDCRVVSVGLVWCLVWTNNNASNCTRHIQVMNPKGRDLVDAAGVQKKFGVTRPGSMRDLQALMGDAAVSSVLLRVTSRGAGYIAHY
jgi:hypothetical protein